MIVLYCATQLGETALYRLLGKIQNQIATVINTNPTQPDLLLFWITNGLKLLATLTAQPLTMEVDLN